MKNVGEFIKEHGIEYDLRNMETADIWTDLKQWDDTLEYLKKRKEMFEGRIEAEVLTKHKIWSKEEAREELLILEAQGAVSFPAFALSPYKFVCGLLEICLEKGMNLQTNTPVVEAST